MPNTRQKADVQRELDEAKKDVDRLESWQNATARGRGVNWGKQIGEKGKFTSADQVRLDEARRKLDNLTVEMKGHTALDDRQAELEKERGVLYYRATDRRLDAAEVKRLESIQNEIVGIQEERRDVARTTAQVQAYRGMNIAKAKKTGRSSDKGPGAVANRDIMRLAMGMGPLETAGVLQATYKVGGAPNQVDANGKAITDREGYALDAQGNKILTGYVNKPEYNAPLGPQTSAARSGSRVGPRTINMTNGMSPREFGMFYASLNEQELRKFQDVLMQAGYYGEGGKPSLGTRDGATNEAMTQFLKDWMQNPDMAVMDLIAKKKAETNALLQADINAISGVGSWDATTENISVTNPKTIEAIVDSVARNLYGTSRVDPAIRKQIVEQIQAQDRYYGEQTAKANYEKTRQDKMVAAGAGNPNEFDAFVEALIGNESGGDANAENARTGASGLGQIMPDNWTPWATEAGQNPADYSAENQRRVIRYQLAKMYKLYGNYRDVGIAWYSGQPSTSWSAATLDRPQGAGDEPSMNEYADALLSRMQANLGNKLNTPANGGNGLSFNYLESAPNQDDLIREQLKAADPARYAGSVFEKQANNFFSIIKGYPRS